MCNGSLETDLSWKLKPIARRWHDSLTPLALGSIHGISDPLPSWFPLYPSNHQHYKLADRKDKETFVAVAMPFLYTILLIPLKVHFAVVNAFRRLGWCSLAFFSLYSLHTVAAGLGSGRGCGQLRDHLLICALHPFPFLVFMPFFFTFPAPSYSSSWHRPCPGHTHCFPLSHLLLCFFLKKYFHLFIFGHSESLGATSELCFLKKSPDTNTTL